MYIQYTRPMQPITVFKGKVPRVKRAKREEVPEAYRKKRFVDHINPYFEKLKPYISEILLHIIGIVELIRKENSHVRK